MGNGTVFGQVLINIRVEKIQFGTAHIHFPYPGVQVTSRKGNAHGSPFIILVTDRNGRYLLEIYHLTLTHLISLRRELLAKITIPVEQSYGSHRHGFIRGFFQVIAGQYAQPS